jgi:cytochrome P450
MQKNVALVSEAMLALPLRIPWTRFNKGLQVIIQIIHVFNIYIYIYIHFFCFAVNWLFELKTDKMQARKRIMDILEKVINERRSGIGTSRVDFLQQLLTDDNKLEKDEVTRLTDKEIKDNILTMIIAGKEYY